MVIEVGAPMRTETRADRTIDARTWRTADYPTHPSEQVPKRLRQARECATMSRSAGTALTFPATSLRGIRTTSSAHSAVITPDSPRDTASIAATPNREPRVRL